LSSVTFFVAPVPPFRLDLTAWAIRRRPENTIDAWEGDTYSRVLVVGDAPISVAVRQVEPPDRPRLRIVADGSGSASHLERVVTGALDQLLGLQVDLSGFYRVAAQDPLLDALAQRFRGLKPPRFPTVFEALVNAIACQQITLTQGIRLLNRLAEAHGQGTAGTRARALPDARRLANADPPALRSLGLSRQKAQALLDLAQEVATGSLDLDRLGELDDAMAVRRLRALRGIGRWTAEYALLRGLGRLNVFPGDDVGARNNLQRWLGLTAPLDYAAVHRTLAAWQPYAGLVYFHLLLDRLAAVGHLS